MSETEKKTTGLKNNVPLEEMEAFIEKKEAEIKLMENLLVKINEKQLEKPKNQT